MAKNPAFELFETICSELAARETVVFPEDRCDPLLIDELKAAFRESKAAVAFDRGMDQIQEHFKSKGASLPFVWERETRQFERKDTKYVSFIAFATQHRGAAKQSRVFENHCFERLTLRLTGAVHLVGWPRHRLKKKAQFVAYLQELGFDRNCLESHDKDGGLDILWATPLGSVPLRPLVSIQCKNASFDENEGNQSAARVIRTLDRHSHIRGRNHLVFVLFNDYIDEERFLGRAAGWIFIPIGLSDLTTPSEPALVLSVL